MIHPSRLDSGILDSSILVRPDIENPLLYIPENGYALFPIFVKLKMRFTNMIFPECANESLKKCVVRCTFINILNSLEKTRSSLSMNQLFETSNLSPSEYEEFREFIKGGIKTLEGK